MFREPHPADSKGICSRCGERYYLSDGCPCDELSDQELLMVLAERDAAIIDQYEDDLYFNN